MSALLDDSADGTIGIAKGVAMVKEPLVMMWRRRLWLATGIRIPVLDRFGLWFHWHGDEVGYLWPWKRYRKGYRWYANSFESTFRTLEEIDRCWEGYIEACNRPVDHDG